MTVRIIATRSASLLFLPSFCPRDFAHTLHILEESLQSYGLTEVVVIRRSVSVNIVWVVYTDT